ncbi:MAG TPA: gephyrin-like molybdotransferase Glp [Acidimicrobiia bacterium]|nr:gephyrin-like molybdotransferase Glp [Acidimicrobiia bacterium]
MRPLRQAQATVLSGVRQLPVTEITLDEALGLVLAEEVRAPHDVPPFANSAMDGYAVIAADIAAAPATLSVIEEVAAGRVPTTTVTPGSAIKIMTGATIPDGADAVVPVEVTRQEGDRVEILEAVPKGASVRAAGGDVAAGATVLRTGERLGPAHLAVLASIGVGRVKTYRRPRVAIMSTGDELRPPDTAELGPGQIRDTNRPLLAALLSELGVEVIDLGIIPDDEQTLRSALLRASAEADAVVTSGGVSMGEYDLVKQLVGELGGIEVWQTAMQPAKPFAFGRLGGTPFFGLPGNPVSVMVAFEQFARPALLQMMGAEKLFRPRVSGVLVGGAETDPAKTVFLRVRTWWEDGTLHAESSGGQSSNVLSALAAADAFAVVPEGVSTVPAGGPVVLEMFRQAESRTADEALAQ